MLSRITLDLIRVTEDAAIACAKHVGKGDKHAADKAATEAMRRRMNDLEIDGRIVIGEGERDEAPMLFIGEEVGKGGLEVDFAVDPLECTNHAAYARKNSWTVLAAAPKGDLLHAPDTYMDKLAVGPKAKGKVDIDMSVKEKIDAVASALGKKVEEICVTVIERDRHKDLIDEIRSTGAKIKFFSDGDVEGAILSCIEGSGVDMLLGIGAAPEGVIAASAVKCLGGDFQGRFKFRSDEDKERGISMGVDPNKKYLMEDLVKGNECMFIATGVTDGDLVDGVRKENGMIATHSVVMRAKTGSVRFIKSKRFEKDG